MKSMTKLIVGLLLVLSILCVWNAHKVLALTEEELDHIEMHNGEAAPVPEGVPCASPLGTILGWSSGVPAYSNCNDDTTTFTGSYVHDTTGVQLFVDLTDADEVNEAAQKNPRAVYIGMKWQCVEYARRYLHTARELAFGDVDSAWQIWELEPHKVLDRGEYKELLEVEHAPGRTHYRLEKHQNGFTSVAPQVGDILIWERQDGMPHGHVAIVVGVSGTVIPARPELGEIGDKVELKVEIGEQNYDSLPWEGKNYSRALKLEVHRVGGQSISHPEGPLQRDQPGVDVDRYTLSDNDKAHIVGWLRAVDDRSPRFDEPLKDLYDPEDFGLYEANPHGDLRKARRNQKRHKEELSKSENPEEESSKRPEDAQAERDEL